MLSFERHKMKADEADLAAEIASAAKAVDENRELDRLTKIEEGSQFVLFSASGLHMCLPVEDVSELVALQGLVITPLPALSGPFAGIVRLRGRLMPVIDLAEHMGREAVVRGGQARLVLCKHHEGMMALLVSEVIAVETLPKSAFRELAASKWGQYGKFISSMLCYEEIDYAVLAETVLWTFLRSSLSLREGK